MDIFKPIELFANLLTYQWFQIAPHSYLGSAVNFFVYDTIKIGIMLIIINYFMAIIRFYFPMEKTKDILTKKRWFGLDYLLAALLGVVTPFCSCSSIPLFIGFLSAGIPLGVTFAFLISSPLINESSLYLFPAMFGMKMTVIYNVLGIIIAMLGGFIIEKLNLRKYVKMDFLKKSSLKKKSPKTKFSWKLLKYFWEDGIYITKNIFPYAVFGVGIGALIHGFVPASIIEKYLSSRQWWVVPAATLSGAPFYANSVSVIPVMEALVKKGVPLGTALSFMTSIVTLSAPEFMILKKVMKWQLLLAFFSITTIGIIILGYIFNFLF